MNDDGFDSTLPPQEQWAASKGFSPKSGGIEAILGNLDLYVGRMMERAAKAAGEIATLLSNYAKANHPWTPRTGATDLSIMGPDNWQEVEQGVFEIVLSAGMDYDVYLELAREGKWAWLWPAVEANQDAIQEIIVRNMKI